MDNFRFDDFRLRRTFQEWIAPKRTKFSALNVDFSSPSRDPWAQRGRRTRAS